MTSKLKSTSLSAESTETEILCIGTELLLGNILNSNAKWISEELALLGIPHYKQTVIGDNESRLKKAILESALKCRVLITTGGLGPTQDDITIQTIAKAFNAELEERDGVWLDIKNKLSKKANIISQRNRKQAFLPRSAEIIPNPLGTAPGIIWSPKNNFTIIALPGVPSEMHAMWKQTTASWLRKNLDLHGIFVSKNLKFVGISESNLADKVSDLIELKNPTVAPYANLGEVKLRITAKGKSDKEAEKLITPVVAKIRDRTGKLFYGSNQDSLASIVLDLLKENNETIAVAESCTGGQLSAEFTSISGASNNFIGGVIAYSNKTKEDLLGIPKTLLEKYGAVSPQTVVAMAQGIQKALKSNWAIAISGVAGPEGGTKDKPVGSVHIAVTNLQSHKTSLENFGEHLSRPNIQRLSVIRSLDLIRLMLLERR